jgi:hypothetical protein
MGSVGCDGIARRATLRRSIVITAACFAVAWLCALAATATPVLAAAEWGISLEHHNAYGAQRAACPGGQESRPGEPLCGVDPFTASGKTFDRESGSNEYVITVTNRATTEPTSGIVGVVDQLPAGLSFSGKEPGVEASGMGWACKVASLTSLTCSRADSLPPVASYPPITLHVHVTSDAALGTPPTGGVTNVATIYGGGADPVSASAYDPTAIASVPFGIESFTTSVTDVLENPFTQADGHPFAASAEFIFNYVPDDGGELKTVGGSPKIIETELPPGFIGNPLAIPRCSTLAFSTGEGEAPCPADTAVGFVAFTYSGDTVENGRAKILTQSFHGGYPLYNLESPAGYPAAFGFVGGKSFARLTLNATVRSDGNYGVSLGSRFTPTPTPLSVKVTFCDDGASYTVEFGTVTTASCNPASSFTAMTKPLLTNPTQCAGGAPPTALSADTYQDPGRYASMIAYAGAASASPAFAGQPPTSGTPDPAASFVTGCDNAELVSHFGASSIGVTPQTTQADSSSGIGFDLSIPQSDETDKLATPELRNTTVTLPEGMSVNPPAANGLEACTDAEFGLHTGESGACPPNSQVGTVSVETPVLEKPLEGSVFVGEPECSPCSTQDAEHGRAFRLFLELDQPVTGVGVKLAGHVAADPTTGRLTATFKDNPQLPFGKLHLQIKGGPDAPLATSQTCGVAETTSDLTPWSSEPGVKETEGTPDAKPSSSFIVDWDGAGGRCPSSILFNPSFLAQTASPAAGQFAPLSVSFSRPQVGTEAEERDEQNFARVAVGTPLGLLGKIAGVTQCGEAEANAGTCPQASAIGTTTVGAGTGSHPFYLGGTVYLTGPYKGAPFGLSIVVPAKAGPFSLAGTNGQGDVVVRAAVSVNPATGALTVTSDPLPQIVDGVPLRLHSVRVDVSRPNFVLNPTSCSSQRVTASISGEHVNAGEAGKTVTVFSPFAASACSTLPFTPRFVASTQDSTSRTAGASLVVKVAQAEGEANIGKVDVQLPKLLPSRVSTLRKACLKQTFATNPSSCPPEATVGTAIAHTPLLNAPLIGPAILVSHGAAFPDLEIVLQGEGVTLILDGGTEVKKGITFSRFDTVPDAPISAFELDLPEGPHSALGAARGNLCGRTLDMPTTITGQSGKQVVQVTKIAVTGCKAKARKPLRACKKKPKKRGACEGRARKRHRAKAKSKKASHGKGRK